jgi:hypothetical protein
MKLKNKEKALIKDLELQIDYLVGYAPASNHWKIEYHLRKELIDNSLNDPSTPENIVDKILRIQAKLYDLKQGIANDQRYLQGSLEDYKPEIKHQVRVRDIYGQISYFEL